MLTPSFIWLSYLGSPCIIQADGVSMPLSARYRKSHALLAFISTHPGRPMSRMALLDLLWPEAEPDLARANLRVLLNDLRKIPPPLGDALCIERDWVTFKSAADVITDQGLLDILLLGEAVGLDACRSRLAAVRNTRWFDMDIPMGDVFRAWLEDERRLLDLGLKRIFAEEISLGSKRAKGHAQLAIPPIMLPPAPLQTVVLLRVQFDVIDITQESGVDVLRAWWKTVDAMTAEVAAYGGRRVDVDDAGATYLFGATPQWGIRYQSLRAARAVAEQLPRHRPPRMGVCAGRVLLTDKGGALMPHGHLPLLVERLAWAANADGIAIESGFRDVLPFRDNQNVESCIFQGFAKPVEYFVLPLNVLCSESLPVMAGLDSPIVNRAHELAQLARPRHGFAATRVNGISGVGKSRLVWEHARREMAAGRRVHWLAARAECAHTPWAGLHEWCTRTMPTHSGVTKGHERTREGGARADMASAFNAQRLVPMGERASLRAMVSRAWQGATVIVDDVQWLDKVTVDFIQHIIATRPNIHLIVTCRSPHEPALHLPDCVELDIQPLSDTAMLTLIAARQPQLTTLEQRAAMIRSHGLPVYTLISSLEHGMTGSDTDMRTIIAHCVQHHAEALGVAALLGEHFSMLQLSAIVGASSAHEAVTAASLAGLVTSIHGDQHWQFLHAVVRDEILRCMADERKKILARQTGHALTRQPQLGASVSTQAAVLFEMSGDMEDARLCWWQAGHLACESDDYAAACEHFAHFERIVYPSGNAGLWARIFHGRAQVVQDGYGSPSVGRLALDVLSGLEHLSVAEPEAEPATDRGELLFSAHGLLYLMIGGESRQAGIEQAGKLAALASSAPQQFAADWAHGNTLFFLGKFNDAEPFIERVVAAHDVLDSTQRTRYLPSDPLVFASVQHAWLAWFLGRETWRERLEFALQRVLHSPMRQDECIARAFAAIIYLQEGEDALFAEHASAAHQIALAEGYGFWAMITGLLVAILDACAGRPLHDEWLVTCEAGVEQAYRAGLNSVRWFMTEAWAAAQQWDRVIEVAARAMDDAERCEHSYCLPDILWLRAVAHRARGESLLALQLMDEAIDQAVRMKARGWLARRGDLDAAFYRHGTSSIFDA
jgi:hypothetical protein